MMDCKEVTRLVAESVDRELRWYQRVRVRVHLAMCFVCRRFTRQLALIRKISEIAGGTDALLTDSGVLGGVALSPAAKTRLKERIAHGNSSE